MDEYIVEGYKPLGKKGWGDFVWKDRGNKKSRVKIEHTDSGRNVYLTSVAGGERQRGLGYDEIFPKVWGVNLECCHPPLDRGEVVTICKGIERYPKGEAKPSVSEKVDAKTQGKVLTIGDNKNWVSCIGHHEGSYYYTSSTNPEVVDIGKGSHNANNLFDLMPKEFWRQHFSTKDGIGWSSAASILMAACRRKGEHSKWNYRGRGAWKHKGKTILNCGRSIYHLSTGQSEELGRIDSSHIFTVSKPIRTPHRQVSKTFKPERLSEICQLLSWKNPNDAKLFAGWITIAPLCGALSWRPHIWLTGPKGTGKSTILDLILQPTLSERGLFVQGNTSAAGLRHRTKCDAMPIVFDEAETSDKQSNWRMKAVIEYFRQCSSNTDAVVLKGTADGKGMEFKPSNMGCLSSIKVNLDNEQDVSRFCELELVVPDSDKWPSVRAEINSVLSVEYGFDLFSYVCGEWDFVMRQIAKVEDDIADVVKDRRIAQQYAPMIVGHSALTGESDVDVFDYAGFGVMAKKEGEQSDSDEGLATLSGLTVSYEDTEKLKHTTLGHLVRMAQSTKVIAMGSACYDNDLDMLGLKLIELKNSDGKDELFLFVRSVNPALDRLLRDTKWPSARMLNAALRRIDGVSNHRLREGRARAQGVTLPLYLFSTT